MTPEEWDWIGAKLGCSFSEGYKALIDVSMLYWIGLDLYQPLAVARDFTETSMVAVYEDEISSNPDWDRKMIPFCGIGNGDAYCLKINDAFADEVWFFDHEGGQYEHVSSSFSDWLTSELPLLIG